MDGGYGEDTMSGGDDDDTMTGGDGDDQMSGNSGDDVMDGEGGDDVMAGGYGDDDMTGGLGDDCVKGNGGDDTIWGDDGDDYMEFLDGDDTLLGGYGDDEIHGEGGDDQIAGEEGDDVIYGGKGDDLIVPGSGNDTMYGGEGSDTFEFHQDDIDFYSFQNAFDVIRDWDATNDEASSSTDADLIRLCGQPEFVPVKIQFGTFFADGNQLPDDVMILLSNGQKIFLDNAAVADWYGQNGVETEFFMGIATFTDPLTTGINADDFELVHLPYTCDEINCYDPIEAEDLDEPGIWDVYPT